MDMAKQIAHWRRGAEEDWEVARELVELNRIRHGLFLAHLALEKMLKAHVIRMTQAPAPKIHNLARLSELSGLHLTEELEDTLADMNVFNIEGRYAEMMTPSPSREMADAIMLRVKEAIEWLILQLSKA
jgi:HEPN domain-containing protein